VRKKKRKSEQKKTKESKKKIENIIERKRVGHSFHAVIVF
jgi:hypothetical protein